MMKLKIHPLIIIGLLFTIALLAFIPLVNAQGGALDALPDGVELVTAYEITRSQRQNVATLLDDNSAIMLLEAARIAPILTVARKGDTGHWEVWQLDVWRPITTQYSYYFDYGENFVAMAPAPDGMLVLVSLARSIGQDGRDWHCVSAFVVDMPQSVETDAVADDGLIVIIEK